jgi:hypothetical protein
VQPVEVKRCARCREGKPLDAFAERAKGGKGRAGTCLACMAERRETETFGCTRCSRVLPGTAFHAGNGVQAVGQPCKECKTNAKRAATRERRVAGGRAPYHILSDVDPDTRTGQCRECGPVHVYATGAKSGRGWRCGVRSDELSESNYAAREDIVDKYASAKWHRIRNVDGAAMRGECSQCGDVPVRWNQSGQYFVCKSPHRRRLHADAERRRRRLLQYGLTTEQYAEMLRRQGGVCAICGGTSARADGDGSLVVDHDHATGAVRALLCNLCNAGIGHLRDDPRIMRAAIEYIEKFARLRPRPLDGSDLDPEGPPIDVDR